MGGAQPHSRVLGVVYEHLGVRGHVNIPPTWASWSGLAGRIFLPSLELMSLHSSQLCPTMEEKEQLLQEQLLQDQLEVEAG